MSISVDPGYLNNLLEEFRAVCMSLEEIGCNSLAIVITENSSVEMGSQKGLQFLRDNRAIMEEFYQNCQGVFPTENLEPSRTETYHDQTEQESIGTTKNKQKTRKPKKSPNSKNISIDSSKIKTILFDSMKLKTITVDSVKIIPNLVANTENIKEDENVDVKDKEMTSTAGDEHNDKDLNDDKIDSIGEDSEVKYEMKTDDGIAAAADGDDDDENMDDGDSILSELDHDDDFADEEVETDTKQRVTVGKREKAKPSANKRTRRKTSSMEAYIKIEGDGNQKVYKCGLCSKTYKRSEDLRVHLRKHTGEAPYACEFCFKAFRSQGLLRSHKIMHSTERNFQCNQCGKSFQRLTNLKRHENTQHSDVYPYSCEICGKDFKDPSIYRVHCLTHSESKPFKCNVCSAQFVGQYLLDSHLLIHTGEKPWNCGICDAKFRTKRFLTLHNQRKHTI